MTAAETIRNRCVLRKSGEYVYVFFGMDQIYAVKKHKKLAPVTV